jgi:hypothetical protein
VQRQKPQDAPNDGVQAPLLKRAARLMLNVDMPSGVKRAFVGSLLHGFVLPEIPGWAEVGPVAPTVDPAEVPGLPTILLVSVERLPRSRREGRPGPPLNVVGVCVKPAPRLNPPRLRSPTSGSEGHLLDNRPHEGDDLPSDGGDDHVGVLPMGGELAKPDARWANTCFDPDSGVTTPSPLRGNADGRVARRTVRGCGGSGGFGD